MDFLIFIFRNLDPKLILIQSCLHLICYVLGIKEGTAVIKI